MFGGLEGLPFVQDILGEMCHLLRNHCTESDLPSKQVWLQSCSLSILHVFS